MLAAIGVAAASPADLAKIEHVVVIYAENRSFDNLYGLFPGASGIANATLESTTQLDRDGTPLPGARANMGDLTNAFDFGRR